MSFSRERNILKNTTGRKLHAKRELKCWVPDSVGDVHNNVLIQNVLFPSSFPFLMTRLIMKKRASNDKKTICGLVA